MGGHEHGHHDPYKVPKASIYKVSDVPQLAEVEKALARQNLRDPWLRLDGFLCNSQKLLFSLLKILFNKKHGTIK